MTARNSTRTQARKRAGRILACALLAGPALVYLGSQSPRLPEAAPALTEAGSSSAAALSAAGSDHAGNLPGQLAPSSANGPAAQDESREQQLLDHFGLTRLEMHKDSIALSHNTKVILQNFYSAAPYEVLLEGMAEIQSALAARYGDKVAEEFQVLVHQYHDYDQRMTALDAELNMSDQITDKQVELARQLKITFQDEAFGYERSSSLFRAEREITRAMEKHQAEFDDTDTLSEDDMKRITEEYRGILAGG